MVSSVRLTQQGRFLLSEVKAVWQPFHATQLSTTQPPGFDWDALIRMARGLSVYVRDSYALGAGSLHAAMQGLVMVARMYGTPQMAQGELMRYLTEAVWYPTALLPSQGIRWDGIDDTTARARQSRAPRRRSVAITEVVARIFSNVEINRCCTGDEAKRNPSLRPCRQSVRATRKPSILTRGSVMFP